MDWQLHSTSPRLALAGPIQNGLTVDWYLRNPKVQEHTQTRPHTTITLPSIKHTPLKLKLKLPTHFETLTSTLKTLSNTRRQPITRHLSPSRLYISLNSPNSLLPPNNLSNNRNTHITFLILLLQVILAWPIRVPLVSLDRVDQQRNMRVIRPEQV